MRINHNISSINGHRQMSIALGQQSKATEKLSSGLRINKSSDDAAGLAISEKMRGQIRGLDQSSRNIQDAVSLVQTMEGALNETHSLLQRGRELSVQAANDTNTDSDKTAIQEEINQLNLEVNRIGNTTEFNTKKLLSEDSITNTTNEGLVIQYLKQGWLEQSEKLVKNYYGIQADGVDITVKLVHLGAGGVLAQVGSMVGANGKGTNIDLQIDMDDFTSPSWPNGGSAPQYNDRVIAHEMTHAIMARSTNWGSLNSNAIWFIEGTAEFTQGADERVKASLAGGATAASLVNLVTGAWASDSDHYSAGYAAVRFLNEHIKASGGTGIKELFDQLKTDPNAVTLDTALQSLAHGAYSGGLGATNGSTANSFYKDWLDNGAAFISGMDLTNADTGAVGGADADGGAVKNAEDSVPDVINYSDTPLQGFNVIWPSISGLTYNPLTMQIGANSGQTIDIVLTKVDSVSLGVSGVNVVQNASVAIDKFDGAINTVSKLRSQLGALQNRLEHAMKVNQLNSENTTASESRIRDVDMAKEMMNFTKNNILVQASQAMVAQSNQKSEFVLQLLH